MDIPQVAPVQLTPEETALRKEIEEEFSSRQPYSGKSAHQLMKRLHARGAIPQARLRTFSEPFPGGRGKSHYDVFVSNGCTGDAIFEHPHFVKYLKYFIDGPSLPANTIEGFRSILIEDSGTSGMVLEQLCKFVRSETRRLRYERSTAREQFWRLSQEVGYSHSESIRDAAGSAGH